ncbi:MAG: hypothetical protein GXP04_05800 [Alphaproteobacteria bacterium]|nr:hypothetical protein [Alphaproteobacteria bacterium]
MRQTKNLEQIHDSIYLGFALGSGDTELFREKMAGAENERAELIKLIGAQEAQVKEALTPITLDQAKIASGRLSDCCKARLPN